MSRKAEPGSAVARCASMPRLARHVRVSSRFPCCTARTKSRACPHIVRLRTFQHSRDVHARTATAAFHIQAGAGNPDSPAGGEVPAIRNINSRRPQIFPKKRARSSNKPFCLPAEISSVAAAAGANQGSTKICIVQPHAQRRRRPGEYGVGFGQGMPQLVEAQPVIPALFAA